MNFIGLLFLLVAHYLCGRGLLRLLKAELLPVPAFCLSMILGVPLVSLAPCALQLCHLPIATMPAIIAVILITGLFSLPLLNNYKKPLFPKLVLPVYYEWPFLIICGFFMLVSVWRAFYYPPYARDMLAGPELLAKFAVKEHNMVSSVFRLDLQSTNNYFKSPFITCLQILYKLLVCPFGQVWMSILAIPFWIWLYTILRGRVHPYIAGFLLLFFITVPEVFGYSYVMLYDFCNMVFFFGGCYFLISFMKNEQRPLFLLSIIMFGFATYIRTETLLLIAMMLPVAAVYFVRKQYSFSRMALRLLLFMAIPSAFYFLCMQVFIRQFVPIPFDAASQIRPGAHSILFFLVRLKDIATDLIFCRQGTYLYGYFIFFFCALLPVDLFVFRRFSREAKVALYGVVVVYLGMGLLGYLIPLVDLDNTTKRGLFKLLPLMLLYMANSGTVQYLSGRIINWEKAQMTSEPMEKPTGLAPAHATGEELQDHTNSPAD